MSDPRLAQVIRSGKRADDEFRKLEVYDGLIPAWVIVVSIGLTIGALIGFLILSGVAK